MPEEILRWDGLGTPHGFETRHGDIGAALPGEVLRVRQVHGRVVHTIDGATPRAAYTSEAIAARPAGDALVTAERNLTLAVATADCVPVLLHDPANGVVAAVHAGWRGIAAEIIAATLDAMTARHGTSAARCRAAIGPCVGASVYRVGSEVIERFTTIGIPPEVFREPAANPDGTDSALCDLEATVRFQLQAVGVAADAIWSANRCTASETETFHSYRRDGAAAGRMSAAISLG